MKLTTTQIENGIYEAIRLKLVELGYLPDITNFLPDSEANHTNYLAAIQAIKDTGKKVIFIENEGSYQAREELQENTIVITLEDADQSATGTKSEPEYTYDAGNGNYKKEITSNGLYDLQYRVTMFSYDSTYKAIMEDVLRQVLGFRKVITALENDASPVGEFWLWYRSYLNLDSAKFMERAFLFDVPHIDLIGNQDAGTVARAEEIYVGVTINPDIEKDDPDDILTVIDGS